MATTDREHDTRGLDEALADVRAHMADAHDALRKAGELLQVQLYTLPHGIGLDAPLLKLAQARADSDEYHAGGRSQGDHQHASCRQDDGSMCPRCTAWHHICRRREDAVQELERIGLLLLAGH